MKKLITLLAAVMLCFSLFITVSAAEASPAFNDIQGHWAESIIEHFFNENIVSGYPDGSFKPDGLVSRAELSAVATLAFKLMDENSFYHPDVNLADWFYEYVQFVSPYIPTHQYDGISFRGKSNASRIDVAETLIEIIKYKEDMEIDMPSLEEIHEHIKSIYDDTEYQVGDINYPNVQRLFKYTWLSENMGIIDAESPGYFRPAWGMTRAELLTIIHRIIN